MIFFYVKDKSAEVYAGTQEVKSVRIVQTSNFIIWYTSLLRNYVCKTVNLLTSHTLVVKMKNKTVLYNNE